MPTGLLLLPVVLAAASSAVRVLLIAVMSLIAVCTRSERRAATALDVLRVVALRRGALRDPENVPPPPPALRPGPQ